VVRQAGQFDFCFRPSEPVHEGFIEAVLEFLSGEELLPRVVEVGEGADGAAFLAQAAEREAAEQIEVRAVGQGAGDVADERDAGEHIPRAVPHVFSAVDDGQRDGAAVPEQDEHRHGDEPIQCTGDLRKLGASRSGTIGARREVEGKEYVGAHILRLPRRRHAEVELPSGASFDFGLGELEKQMDGAPAGEECSFFREGPVGIQEFLQLDQRMDGKFSLAAVAERLEER